MSLSIADQLLSDIMFTENIRNNPNIEIEFRLGRVHAGPGNKQTIRQQNVVGGLFRKQ